MAFPQPGGHAGQLNGQAMTNKDAAAAGLELEGVCVTLRGRSLFDITAAITAGSVLTVMGPSGSGKSTLLAYIGGFLDPAFDGRGRVLINGEDVTAKSPQSRHAGILFQDPLLFPHLSVGGNLLFAIPQAVGNKAERIAIARRMLEGMELEGCFDHDPATLSGGQKARVALARTLVSEPRALLLDEPFSKLDTALRQQMRDLVFALARERALPVVLVTHDPDDAAAAAGPIITIG